MSTKKILAALLLTTSLVTAPVLANTSYAHDGEGQPQGEQQEGHWHHHGVFTDAQRKLIHDTMHKLHENDLPARDEMMRLHDHLRLIVDGEQFDQKAFMAAADKIEAKRAEIERDHLRAYASIAGQFDPEQRRMLAHIFMHKHHGMQGGHMGWHHHGMMGGDKQGDGNHGDWQQGMNGADQNQDQSAPQISRNPDYPPYDSH